MVSCQDGTQKHSTLMIRSGDAATEAVTQLLKAFPISDWSKGRYQWKGISLIMLIAGFAGGIRHLKTTPTLKIQVKNILRYTERI